MTPQYATEATKTTIENLVAGVTADKFTSATTTIATKKYLTGDNRLVHITQCNMSGPAVPKVKIQIFERVEGGVHETSLALFADHRFERTENAMIFGIAKDGNTETVSNVDEPTAQWVIQLINSLPSAQQVL